MDEDSGRNLDFPKFITNGLKQLISLKGDLSEAAALKHSAKQINIRVKSDVFDFTEKVNTLIKNIKTTVENVDATFTINYEGFRKEYKFAADKKNIINNKENSDVNENESKCNNVKTGNTKDAATGDSNEQQETNLSESDCDSNVSFGQKLKVKSKKVKPKKCAKKKPDSSSKREKHSSVTDSAGSDLDQCLKTQKKESGINQIEDKSTLEKIGDNVERKSETENYNVVSDHEKADYSASLFSDATINHTSDSDSAEKPAEINKNDDRIAKSHVINDSENDAKAENAKSKKIAKEIANEKVNLENKSEASKDKMTESNNGVIEPNKDASNEMDSKRSDAPDKLDESKSDKCSEKSEEFQELTSTSSSEGTDDEKANTKVKHSENKTEDKDSDDDSKNTDKQSKKSCKDKENNEGKPKMFIKCIDINKLLDPTVKVETDTENPKQTKPIDTVILLSSDSDGEFEKHVKKPKTPNNTESDAKSKQKKNREISKRKPKVNSDSDSDSLNRPNSKRASRKDVNVKSKFGNFKRVRQCKMQRKKIIDSSSNSSSSDSDLDTKNKSKSTSSTNSNKSPDEDLKNTKKGVKKQRNKNIKEIDLSNYDYKTDNKFKVSCCVSLPKIPVEQLKKNYLSDLEDKDLRRLTNMKSLKRTRKLGTGSNSASSSENDAKTVKKRSKLQLKNKHTEKQTENDYMSASDSDTANVPKYLENSANNVALQNEELAIPDSLLSSNDDVDKQSESDKDSSDKEDKKKSKKKDKKTSKEAEKQMELDKENKATNDTDKDAEGNKKDKMEDEAKKNETDKSDKDSSDKDSKGKIKDSSDEDFQGKKKEKIRWKNDKLLKEKINSSDSEDELIRFRKKKDKGEKEAKSKTKTILKRIARRLGSDSNMSSDSENDAKKSSGDEFQNKAEKKSSSSNSDSDDKKKKKPVRKRIKKVKDSEDSSDGGGDVAAVKEKEEDDSTRKKIRGVWDKSSLADTTKQAAKEEEERKKRIAERQKLYNEIYVNDYEANATVDKVVLDFNEETKEELLSVHPDLVSKLKPHQAQGVRFMWTACFESLERAKNTEGSGCILAHCMGLGKTLQVITLIHTLITHTRITQVRTVLVVCPLSTVLNWVNEFRKWLDDIDDTSQINVFDLVAYKQNYERLYQMQDWMKLGGVMVIGYDMFRNLSNPKGKRMSKKLVSGFNKCLLEPGPDLVICDEGHLLKNEKTGISIAMNKLKTRRRIVLTGTPLQNNLKEYFCMVQFVKPNLLGTYKEYLNRFVNPITNGQYTDSTPHDIYIMRKRAHVLHKMLDAIVERRDYNVLAPFLPPKQEYILFVSLTKVQIELYGEYLSKYARKNTAVKGTSFLFNDFQVLQRICIHPRVLMEKSIEDRNRRDLEDDDDSEGSLKDFINDDSDKSTSTPESSDRSDSDAKGKKKAPARRRTRARAKEDPISDDDVEEVKESSNEWWSKFCQGDELENLCHSSKLILLFDILKQCELIGDKVLVFSQSLYSLNLIEYFLSKIDESTQNGSSADMYCGHTGSWALGLDYFRMDGSTSCDNRNIWCKSFNNETNTRARLFLISTRAGGLGINLVAANRVIIFDVSWNPSYDIQSIYRVYRFGQTKPCYIYRFVTMGTMENKIYERQVTKQAISKRVIDEQQIDRHYNQHDLAELYAFNPVPDEERPTPLVPKDRLFADLLQVHEAEIFKYHEHNSLLEDKADEGLNEAERQAAWEEFENEKKAPKFNLMQTMVKNGMYETLRVVVQKDNSTWTPAQVNNVLPTIVQRISEQVTKGDYSMYRRIEEEHERRVLEQRQLQHMYNQYMQQLRTATNTTNPTPPSSSHNNIKFTQMISNMFAGGMGMPSSSSVPTASTPMPTPPIITDIVELND